MPNRKMLVRFNAGFGAVVVLVAAGAAVLSTLGLATATSVSPSVSIPLLAVDADPTGNSPRSVGTVDQCVSADVGQATQIDVVVPDPGIPADHGIGAYQFTLLYDPAVIWIDGDDSAMLLAQASGSNVIPIADPRPDSNGIYESWGIDFGSAGIEPAGTSETGPGVIARLTLLPQSEGSSNLTLTDVLVIDDASDRISLESVQSATINVGQPCQGESVAASTPTPSFGSDTTVPDTGTPSVVVFPDTGSRDALNDDSRSMLIAAVLLSAFGGLALLAVSAARHNASRGRP